MSSNNCWQQSQSNSLLWVESLNRQWSQIILWCIDFDVVTFVLIHLSDVSFSNTCTLYRFSFFFLKLKGFSSKHIVHLCDLNNMLHFSPHKNICRDHFYIIYVHVNLVAVFFSLFLLEWASFLHANNCRSVEEYKTFWWTMYCVASLCACSRFLQNGEPFSKTPPPLVVKKSTGNLFNI